MPLSPNTTLSHYTIVSKIGAGGMGEVYLAQEPKLDSAIRGVAEAYESPSIDVMKRSLSAGRSLRHSMPKPRIFADGHGSDFREVARAYFYFF